MGSAFNRRRKLTRTNLIHLRCQAFEDRVVPAVFSVQNPLTYTGLNNYGCVAVADFDKNGFSDAVLSNYGPNGAPGTNIQILYANGAGGFSRITRNTGGQNVSFVAVADINADTWPDVVAVNGNQGNFGSVAIFRNDGFGNLTQFGDTFSTGGKNSCWIGLADMTGDNILDIVVSSFGVTVGPDNVEFNNVTIFQGNGSQGAGDFTYSPAPIITLRPEVQFVPNALAVADFDGDGIRDIVAVSPSVPADTGLPQTTGVVYAFRGTGGGGFATPDQLETGGALPVNVQAADMTGDGKLDIIIANAGDPNSNPEFNDDGVGFIRNFSTPGSLTFGVPLSIPTNSYGTFAVAAADFDVNGTMDIAAINHGTYQQGSTQPFVSLYLGNGSGAFTPENPGVYNTQTIFGGQYLAVGNLDGNSTPDLFVATAGQVGRLVNLTSVAAAPTITGTQINGGAAQRSRVTNLTVTFSAPVNFAGGNVAGAFTLTRNGGGGTVSFQATANIVGGVTVVTLNNFTGTATQGNGTLIDGRYTLTALAANITSTGGLQLDGDGNGTPGGNYVFSPQGNQGFFRLFGDANGDQRVDISDYGLFATSYNKSAGDIGFLAYFDFDGNGRVDIADLGQFSLRYLVTFP